MKMMRSCIIWSALIQIIWWRGVIFNRMLQTDPYVVMAIHLCSVGKINDFMSPFMCPGKALERAIGDSLAHLTGDPPRSMIA
jgi:hypothetical protein